MTVVKAVIILLALVSFIGLTFKFYKDSGAELGYSFAFRLKGFVAGLALLIVALVLTVSVGQVNAGAVGVVLNLGAVTGRTIEPGPYMVMPFIQTVEIMDTQTQKYESKATSASKDLQDVSTTVTVNYSLIPEQAPLVWQNLRRDYVERVLSPAVQESVKASTALSVAEKLIQDRPLVKAEIERVLAERTATFGIRVHAVSITDFTFSRTFSEAIEAKVSAAQKALEAENKLLQVEVEARQAKTSAEGRANAAIAEAEGEARAIRTVAEAQAEANRLLNDTLTEQIIRYELTRKLGDDIKVIVLPSGNNFILGPEVLGP